MLLFECIYYELLAPRARQLLIKFLHLVETLLYGDNLKNFYVNNNSRNTSRILQNLLFIFLK